MSSNKFSAEITNRSKNILQQ